MTIVCRNSNSKLCELLMASFNYSISASVISFGITGFMITFQSGIRSLCLSKVRMSKFLRYLKQIVFTSVSSLWINVLMRSRLAGVVITVRIGPSFGSSSRQLRALNYWSIEFYGPRRSIMEKTVIERISYAEVSVMDTELIELGVYTFSGEEFGDSFLVRTLLLKLRSRTMMSLIYGEYRWSSIFSIISWCS